MQNFPSFRSSSSSSVDGKQQKSSFWKISLSMTLESFFRCDVFEFERVEKSKATFSRPYFLVFPALQAMYHDVIVDVDKVCKNYVLIRFSRLQQKLYTESKSKLKFFSVFQRYRQRPPVNLSKRGDACCHVVKMGWGCAHLVISLVVVWRLHIAKCTLL